MVGQKLTKQKLMIGRHNMENYELTVEHIEHYKSKACDFINGNCDKCEAAYMYYGKQYCCFDTVARFVEYANKHNI